ncbi:MAG: hypothetical protein KJN71_06970, partial [Acidimicrobiia bacterium]|nr:hypothetical protein [Acidimicrobiia bacterium]
MMYRSLGACLGVLIVMAGCGNEPASSAVDPTDSLVASLAEKAVVDSGFNIPAEIFVREALYEDVMAVQYEGVPEFLVEGDKSALLSKFSDQAPVVFFTDPSAVVDGDWNLLPNRLVVLIGPIENVEGGQVVAVGVLAGSGLDNAYVGRYPVNPDTGEVSDSPRITMV